MNIRRYDDWKDTALTLHMISQMLGKTKLARMPPQPEWSHIVMTLSADGIGTGLIPNGVKTFSVDILAREGKVLTTGIDGRSSSFVLQEGMSVSDYFAEYNRMLADVMCETEMYTVPQEMGITTPFEKNKDKLHYDGRQAVDFFHMCVFAHNAILEFVSPYRGKKLLPSFFWGTFDVTGILFNGKHVPFPGEGIIEKVAFDEQMIEFGFWPGDDMVGDPSFFILPYPFLTDDLTGIPVRPDRAVFSKEKAEYFLKIEDVMSYDDPGRIMQEFFHDTYRTITNIENWDNLDWLHLPLLTDKGSSALKRPRVND